MLVPLTPLAPSIAKANGVGMVACNAALFALIALSTFASDAPADPSAVSVMEPPLQIVAVGGVMLTVGSAFTTTVTA